MKLFKTKICTAFKTLWEHIEYTVIICAIAVFMWAITWLIIGLVNLNTNILDIPN